MNLSRIFIFLFVLMLLGLPSCFHDNEISDYSEWAFLNTQAFNDSAALTNADGNLVYKEITPVWDPSFSVLMKWDETNDNPSDVKPLSTSTCVVKYTLTNINGDTLDSSPSFTCVPNNMVTGFMAALTEMRVNDTVTAIIPAKAGYGEYGSGAVLPYSTLVFGIRLDSISKLM